MIWNLAIRDNSVSGCWSKAQAHNLPCLQAGMGFAI